MITQQQLETFRQKLETHCQKLYFQMGFSLNPPIIEISQSVKYARIVRKSPHSSAYGFIEMSTGDIFYPAGWKGPSKNQIRGNISSENALDCCGWSSVKTLK